MRPACSGDLESIDDAMVDDEDQFDKPHAVVQGDFLIPSPDDSVCPTMPLRTNSELQRREERRGVLIEQARSHLHQLGIKPTQRLLLEGAKRHNTAESVTAWCIDNEGHSAYDETNDNRSRKGWSFSWATSKTQQRALTRAPRLVETTSAKKAEVLSMGYVMLLPKETHGLRVLPDSKRVVLTRRDIGNPYRSPSGFFLDTAGNFYVNFRLNRKIDRQVRYYLQPKTTWVSAALSFYPCGAFDVEAVPADEVDPKRRAFWELDETTGILSVTVSDLGRLALTVSARRSELTLVQHSGNRNRYSTWAFLPTDKEVRRIINARDGNEIARKEQAQVDEAKRVSMEEFHVKRNEDEDLERAVAASVEAEPANETALLFPAAVVQAKTAWEEQHQNSEYYPCQTAEEDKTETHGQLLERPWSPPLGAEEQVTNRLYSSSKGRNVQMKPRPALAELSPIEELVEYLGKYRVGVRSVVESLRSEGFVNWRGVRGDGNCYYRAVAFAMIEALLERGEAEVLIRVADRLEKVELSNVDEDVDVGVAVPLEAIKEDHVTFIQCLRDFTYELKKDNGGEQAQKFGTAIANDSKLDLSLVRAARCLVAEFLRSHGMDAVEDAKADLLAARDQLYNYPEQPKPRQKESADDFTVAAALGHFEDPRDLELSDPMRRVWTLGEDAEGLVTDLGILPRLLGGDCQIWAIFNDMARLVGAGYDHTQLSGTAEHSLIEFTTGIERKRPVNIHVVLNPGHYFLLYRGPNQPRLTSPLAISSSPSLKEGKRTDPLSPGHASPGNRLGASQRRH